MNTYRRTRAAACLALLAVAALSACGPTFAEKRETLDAEWAITNARSDEIDAEYMRRIDLATTPEEREAAIQWRADELEKNFADHRARKAGALKSLEDD